MRVYSWGVNFEHFLGYHLNVYEPGRNGQNGDEEQLRLEFLNDLGMK